MAAPALRASQSSRRVSPGGCPVRPASVRPALSAAMIPGSRPANLSARVEGGDLVGPRGHDAREPADAGEGHVGLALHQPEAGLMKSWS